MPWSGTQRALKVIDIKLSNVVCWEGEVHAFFPAACANDMKKLLDWFYRKIVRLNLLHAKRQDLAIFGILELYVTERIIEGNVDRRGELSNLQKQIKETKELLEFIKNVK